MHPLSLRSFAVAAALVCGLSACGGGGGDSTSPTAPSPAPTTPVPLPSPSPDATLTKRTLVIDVDGATYSAAQKGIAAGTLPNLAKLELRLAYSGGMAGTPSQQPTLDTPGWATLLTGSWASRHEVMSEAPRQALHTASVFQMAKEQKVGSTGAAVASTGLAGLLSADKEAGYLDVLADCSKDAASTDCVTTQATQLIGGRHATVVAQYRAAKDAALDYGVGSRQYAATLSGLDTAIGRLVAATASPATDRWLIVVTGNHGLSENSQDDGLPLVPESSTFLALNQAANIGAQGVGAAVPATLAELYANPSIADVTPTLLGYLTTLPEAKDYAMDGGTLVGAQPVAQLAASVVDNNSSAAGVSLTWTAPANQAITVFRDGQVIASRLTAGTSTYVDNQLPQLLTAKGTYQFNYTVQAGDGAEAASRATISPPVTYVPPVPLASTLVNGLVSYYPIVTDDVPIVFMNLVPYHTATVKRVANVPVTIWGAASPLDEVYLK